MSDANDERLLKVIWDGTIDRFEVFRNNVESDYFERGVDFFVDCYIDFLDEIPSTSQIKTDVRALHGSLLSACQRTVGRRILMENRDKQDAIRSWCQLLQQYETDGNTNVRIKN
jgi:hypothetical protein